MKRFDFLVWVLILFTSVCKCAEYINFYEITGPVIQNAPEKLEKLIDAVFENSFLTHGDDSGSLFQVLVPLYASLTNISQTEQYILYTSALFEYLNKKCLSAIMDYKKGQLREEDRKKMIIRIWFTRIETRFFNDYKESIKIPAKTASLMIRTLYIIEPDIKHIRSLVTNLWKFCDTDACDDIVYKSVLVSLEDPEKQLSFFESRQCMETFDKYNDFISTIFNIYNTEATTNQVPILTFVENLLYGPPTTVASRILLSVLSLYELESIFNGDETRNRLIKMLIDTNSVEDFISIFMTEDICETFPEFGKFKSELLEFKGYRDRIQSLIAYERNFDTESFINLVARYSRSRDSFTEYAKIDFDYVTDRVLEIIREMFSLIENLKEINDDKTNQCLIFSTFVLLNSIPQISFDNIPLTDFDPLLDSFHEYFDIETSQSVIKKFQPEYICYILINHISKIKMSTVDKVYRAIKLLDPESDFLFGTTIILSLLNRRKNDQMFLETFENVYQFYQLRQLNMEFIANVMINKLFETEDFFLARKLVSFCKENKVISKSRIILYEKYLAEFSTSFDFHSF